MDDLRCAAALAAGALALLWRARRRDLVCTAHQATRPLGSGGASIPVLGMGGASIGDLYLKLDNAEALGALEAAHAAGIAFFDTSPYYGPGLSEARFGLALHRVPRKSFWLETKVGRYLLPDRDAVNGTAVGWIGGYHFKLKYDYSGPAIVAQLHESLQRTGLGFVDSLVVHDLEPTIHRDVATGDDGVATARMHLAELRASGFAALQRLRDAGEISAFGAGVNSDEDGEDVAVKAAWNREYTTALLGMHKESTASGGRGLDFFLFANLHSLLNTEALESGMLADCAAAGVSVIVGGPYSSGILATGADPAGGGVPYYNYTPASEEVRARTRRIEAVCACHGVPLIAAALQYPLRHPAVASVIPGGKSAEEVRANVRNMNVRIPAALWADLAAQGLVKEGA